MFIPLQLCFRSEMGSCQKDVASGCKEPVLEHMMGSNDHVVAVAPPEGNVSAHFWAQTFSNR